MPFVIFFPGYWHFENAVTIVNEDVLLDPDGLPYVLALAVPLLIFLAGSLSVCLSVNFMQ